MQVTVWHNPKCSNSRGALEILRERGIEPEIFEYVKTPPTRAQLRALVKALDIPLREALRSKEAVYAELGLGAPGVTDAQVFEAVLAHPVLLNRPIVVTARGAKLCRPPETVLELLR
jgi:arsenate reductase